MSKSQPTEKEIAKTVAWAEKQDKKSESAVKKQNKPYLFQPGQSGNPAGRKKGSRNKLADAFLRSLYEDFKSHGISVIEEVRIDKPSEYLKVVASLVPKEFHLKVDPFEELTDEQLVARARELGSALAIFRVKPNPANAENPQGSEPVIDVPTLSETA